MILTIRWSNGSRGDVSFNPVSDSLTGIRGNQNICPDMYLISPTPDDKFTVVDRDIILNTISIFGKNTNIKPLYDYMIGIGNLLDSVKTITIEHCSTSVGKSYSMYSNDVSNLPYNRKDEPSVYSVLYAMGYDTVEILEDNGYGEWRYDSHRNVHLRTKDIVVEVTTNTTK